MSYPVSFALFVLLLTPAWGVAPSEDEELDKGVLLALDGEYEEALEVFLGLLRRKPNDPVLNYYTGLIHFYLEQSAEAAVYLEKSIKEDAPFPEAYYWLAQAHLSEQQMDEAKKTVAAGLKEFPGNKDLEELGKLLRE